jgi:hypothetical protein
MLWRDRRGLCRTVRWARPAIAKVHRGVLSDVAEGWDERANVIGGVGLRANGLAGRAYIPVSTYPRGVLGAANVTEMAALALEPADQLILAALVCERVAEVQGRDHHFAALRRSSKQIKSYPNHVRGA